MATAGNVTPGNYYNDGTKRVKVANEADINRYYSTEITAVMYLPPQQILLSLVQLYPPEVGAYLVMFNGQCRTGEVVPVVIV